MKKISLKTENERYEFLKQAILQKMELLTEVVKKRKLDTNMDLLKSDLEKSLQEFFYLVVIFFKEAVRIFRIASLNLKVSIKYFQRHNIIN